MIAKTRLRFNSPEYYQLYLNEWRSLMLKDVAAANPDKNLLWCLKYVINKLQKIHQILLHNYSNSEGNLRNQLISACQKVEACFIMLIRPVESFEEVTAEFRNAVGVYTRNRSQRSYNTVPDPNPGENAYYTEKSYGRSQIFPGNYGYRGRSRGGYKGGYSNRSSRNRRCYVCGKFGCWFIRHHLTKSEQRTHAT
jgi:hypothetical protein